VKEYKNWSFVSDSSKTIEVEKFLRDHCGLQPRAILKRKLREKFVLVNGRIADRLTLVRPKDRVDVLRGDDLYIAAEGQKIKPNPKIDCDVIYECSDYVVVNKTAGQHSHPIRTSETDTLLNALVARYPECAEEGRIGRPLEGLLVHRLDEGTSGLIVCARTKSAFKQLQTLWAARSVTKIYTAWLRGTIVTAGTVELKLEHDPKSKKRMRVARASSKDGWTTSTSIYPIAHENDHTLVLLQIHTGVTHQIRATMAHLGVPVAGDPIYGEPQSKATRSATVKIRGLPHEELHRFHLLKNQLKPSRWRSPKRTSKNRGFSLHATFLALPLPYDQQWFCPPIHWDH